MKNLSQSIISLRKYSLQRIRTFGTENKKTYLKDSSEFNLYIYHEI